MIEVKDLVKEYDGHRAVDHLSFTVPDGQIYGFLGPNGAGKSTTMNIMTGYLGATSGQVLINGHNILEEPEKAKKSIGYLPELPPLYTDMTVYEYLSFAAKLKKLPKSQREASIQEVMELVGLTGVQGRLIRNLSKGYRQRAGMAQALLGKPQVIILDEPTVGLDPKQIIEIRDMIRKLGKEHTVILSSHILSEVSAVCDHILIISHGKLAASGTPEQLEQQLAGAGGLKLTIKGEKESAKEALRILPGVQDISCDPGQKDGIFYFNLIFAPSSEKDSGDPEHLALREAVFHAMAKGGHAILSMEPVRASLEDVFLELTGDGQDKDAEAPDLRETKAEQENSEEDPEHESNL